MPTSYKTKTERDLVFDENKDAIRAMVRLEVNRLYKRRTNLLIDKMQDEFNRRWKEDGELWRLLPPPTNEMQAMVESGANDLLELTAGE